MGTVAYALMAASGISEAENRRIISEIHQLPNNYERFGSEYFLTDFSSERSFKDGADARVHQDKKRRRRRSSWKKYSLNLNNHIQHFKRDS